jgi:hypothetical protein
MKNDKPKLLDLNPALPDIYQELGVRLSTKLYWELDDKIFFPLNRRLFYRLFKVLGKNINYIFHK